MNVFGSGGGLDEPRFLVFHPSTAPAPTAVPTMAEWGMVIMSVLLGGSGIYLLRRRKAV